jgi:uncharacterized protein (DUF433 family)
MAAARRDSSNMWRQRLALPSYAVVEAAKYAELTANTVRAWHRISSERPFLRREARSALSYYQLIEIAVVAAFRKEGVTLKRIREARAYLVENLKSEFPFAQYRFKTDGKKLLLDYAQVEKKSGEGKYLEANQSGQLAWKDIVDARLQEFEYERGMVLRWHVDGSQSPVVIDPRVQFGRPQVSGIPTWVLKDRWEGGEELAAISRDFDLPKDAVQSALAFEGVDINPHKQAWRH